MGGSHAGHGGLRLSEARRWRVLGLLALAEVLGMSLWFSASAVSGQYRALWQLTPGEAGWLTTSVQLGFVVGTAGAAVLNLADIISSRWYFAASALLGAAANAALAWAADYPTALVCRFATGVFLAGVYPPAMKMAATWFRSDRGLAIGVIVASLTVGKAMPYLVRSVEPSGVRSSRVKVALTRTATSGAADRVAARACSISRRSDWVSITNRSTPAAARAAACS